MNSRETSIVSVGIAGVVLAVLGATTLALGTSWHFTLTEAIVVDWLGASDASVNSITLWLLSTGLSLLGEGGAMMRAVSPTPLWK